MKASALTIATFAGQIRWKIKSTPKWIFLPDETSREGHIPSRWCLYILMSVCILIFFHSGVGLSDHMPSCTRYSIYTPFALNGNLAISFWLNECSFVNICKIWIFIFNVRGAQLHGFFPFRQKKGILFARHRFFSSFDRYLSVPGVLNRMDAFLLWSFPEWNPLSFHTSAIRNIVSFRTVSLEQNGCFITVPF